MDATFSIARSGMAAAQRSMDVSAHNIANAATVGFKRQRVDLATQASGGVEASAAASSEAQGGKGLAEGLAEDVVRQRVALYGFKASARVVQAQDAMMGALLNLKA